jgi:hypothetical protein
VNALSERPKFVKLLVAFAVAFPLLLGVGWAAGYLKSARAGEHVIGQRYEGRLKYIEKRRMGKGRYGVGRSNTIRLAIVESKDKREIIVHDPAQRFAGCDSGDDIGYRMEDSAVRGVDFIYVQGSCADR